MKNTSPPKSLYSVLYFDRAHIWITPELYMDRVHLKNSVSPYCAQVQFHRRINGFVIHLSQPTSMAFKILSDYCGVGNVFYLEIAWDFITHNRLDAEKLQEWFCSHMIELNRGCKKKASYYEIPKKNNNEVTNTRYSDDYSKNHNIMYADKLSKKENRPCFHIEWRLRNAQSVFEAVGGITNIATMNDNAHMAFWKRKIKFVQINLNKLGRVVLGMTRSKGRLKKSLVKRVPLPRNNNDIFYDKLHRVGSVYFRAYGLDVHGREDIQMLADEVLRSFNEDHTKFTDKLCPPPPDSMCNAT